MKRLNPKTNVPFKQGDIRDDGYIFRSYKMFKPVRRDGFYREDWRNLDSFEKSKNTISIWQKSNRESCNKAHRKWTENNKEKCYSYNAEWWKANPGKKNAKTMKRHAAKLQRTPPWLTVEHHAQIAEFYSMAKELEKVFPWPQHVDHIEALQGVDVCGLHVPWNLQILSRKANLEKGNR